MDVMLLLLVDPQASYPPEVHQSVQQRMGEFAMGLGKAGKIKGGSPLHGPEHGARVSKRGGQLVVSDGPFAESREVVGGYFILDCESMDEAKEIASRCPHAEVGLVEVRAVMDVGEMMRGH